MVFAVGLQGGIAVEQVAVLSLVRWQAEESVVKFSLYPSHLLVVGLATVCLNPFFYLFRRGFYIIKGYTVEEGQVVGLQFLALHHHFRGFVLVDVIVVEQFPYLQVLLCQGW